MLRRAREDSEDEEVYFSGSMSLQSKAKWLEIPGWILKLGLLMVDTFLPLPNLRSSVDLAAGIGWHLPLRPRVGPNCVSRNTRLPDLQST